MRVNPTRLSEYQEQVLHVAATKIQSIWRGSKVRSTKRVSIVQRDILRLADIHTDTLNVNSGDVNRLERILDKIREKSQKYDQKPYSRAEIMQKCNQLNGLMEKRMNRERVRVVNPAPAHDFVERTSYWLDACTNQDLTVSHARSDRDPVVDDLMRSLHSAAVKKANHGWWKEKISTNTKWNDPDPDFDSWIAEIESIPVVGVDRYF